jgi:hypothetical protein
VHLRFIESFGTTTANEDATADRLKGDTTLNIRTISGAEYSVSINDVLTKMGYLSMSHAEAVDALRDKWEEIQHKEVR